MKSLPEILKENRKKLNLSQAEMSMKLGIQQVRYSYYESGRNKPKQDFFNKYKKTFDIDLLITNDENSIINTASENQEKYGQDGKYWQNRDGENTHILTDSANKSHELSVDERTTYERRLDELLRQNGVLVDNNAKLINNAVVIAEMLSKPSSASDQEILEGFAAIRVEVRELLASLYNQPLREGLSQTAAKVELDRRVNDIQEKISKRSSQHA